MANVLTVREVSDYLRVHPATIYRLLKLHQIPAFKVGSDWRFNLESLDRWCLGSEKGAKPARSVPEVKSLSRNFSQRLDKT